MRRVVVTGMGIVSSIGNNKEEVLAALQSGRSGIVFNQEYADIGMSSHVHGAIKIDVEPLIDRKLRRFMGDGAAYAYLSMREAIADARLTPEQISEPRVGLVAGTGGASTQHVVEMADTLRSKGARKVSPFIVPRIMGSTVSACLAVAYSIRGVNYSITSACATSAHCIGNAYELIRHGMQDRVFAGGGESVHWTMSLAFDAMGALSTKYNTAPESASRPFDTGRDGFVISGGGGIVVLEELEIAQRRGAKIYAEIIGYGANSDGVDMVQPSGEGAVRCMRSALTGVVGRVDYINTHGTGTRVGDVKELEAIREVFHPDIPLINSTKSQTGHALGATGVNEVIYSLLMMENRFVSASANIAELEPSAQGLPIVRERRDNVPLTTVMSNSFGFGGTNAALVLRKW